MEVLLQLGGVCPARRLDRAVLGKSQRPGQERQEGWNALSVLITQQFDVFVLQFASDRDTAGGEARVTAQPAGDGLQVPRLREPKELADEVMDRVARKLLEAPPADADPRALRFGRGVERGRASHFTGRGRWPCQTVGIGPDEHGPFHADDEPERGRAIASSAVLVD